MQEERKKGGRGLNFIHHFPEVAGKEKKKSWKGREQRGGKGKEKKDSFQNHFLSVKGGSTLFGRKKSISISLKEDNYKRGCGRGKCEVIDPPHVHRKNKGSA